MKTIEKIIKINGEEKSHDTTNVYTYKELSEEAKEKVRDEVSTEVGDKASYFLLFDFCTMLDQDYNIKDVEEKDICCSLDYCQGDGVSFTADEIIDYVKLENKVEEEMNAFEKYLIKNLSQKELENLIFDMKNNDLVFNIKRNSTDYCHSNTCTIDYNYTYTKEGLASDKEDKDFIYNLSNILHEKVYCVICSKLEDYGYNELYPTDRCVIEDFLENEDNDGYVRYYTEDGKRFYTED